MNEKPASPGKGHIVAQLETIEKLTQRLLAVVKGLPGEKQDEKLLQLSMQFACIDFARLKDQAGKESAPAPATEPENPVTSAQLSKLVQEIELSEKKIHEFKISLADSVMENKSMQRQLNETLEKNSALTSQVAQMQLHSKDLTMKLSTTAGNLETRENELEAVKKELMDLRSRNYQLKSQTAEFEDQLQAATKKAEQAQLLHSHLTQQNEKVSRDIEHVLTSNSKLKGTIESLEFREKELEDAIESLQREKNHLQARLDKLIIGSKKSVPYHQPLQSHELTSILEPSEFPAYLPFCFPERLPAAIRFRREIKKTWAASFKREEPSHPQIFRSQSSSPLFPMAPRSHKTIPAIKPFTREPQPLLLSKEVSFNQSIEQQPLKCAEKPFSIAIDYKSLSNFLENKSGYVVKRKSKELKVFENSRFMPRKIYTTSFALYLSHLSQGRMNLLLKSSQLLPHKIKPFARNISNDVQLKIANIFIEKLAFRHRFQLQSQKLLTPIPTFNCSFKRGNKLKSVLETFGNTITSMVQKYDIIANSSTRNGEAAK